MTADKRIRCCTALLILNLAIIWGNSLLPAEISGAISGYLAQILGRIQGMSQAEAAAGDGLLRKLAHFTEFACLGLLLARRFTLTGHETGEIISRTMLGGFAAACTDETIQIFVSGRSSSLTDVWIDVCGAAAGLMILLIGVKIVKNRKQFTFWRKQ